MAFRQKPIPPAELEVWARYLRHVTPLAGMVAPVAPERTEPARPVPAAALAYNSTPTPIRKVTHRRVDVAIGVAPPGLDRATWARFRSGKIGPDRVLDLHGMTKPAAHVAVTALVSAAVAQGLRCVEIVTGHGRRGGGEGVLRREVPFWLNDQPLRAMILAVCHPHATNEGALRVLIRRTRT